MSTLVIVESPAKCKKIESYLGNGYRCVASFGHIRGLLDGLKGINIEKNFEPSFAVMPAKRKQVATLRKEINKAREVILATDDDREGEAIAWHICKEFRLPVETTKRIIFHEITKPAITRAVMAPKTVNMPMVHAQHARQILDVLVGYKVSPQLWKHISHNTESKLSAGRCQTPALRIVYDNQMEIDKNPGKKLYQTTGTFTKKNIEFELNETHDNEEKIEEFLEETAEHDHKYDCSSVRETTKTQPTPFTTSKLQQTASNEIHSSPKQTMSMCQKLYEAGLITYMRTDSKTYSKDFVDKIVKYIKQKYDSSYVRSDIGKLTERTAAKEDKKKSATKAKQTKQAKGGKEKKDSGNAQEAHEAIRPTDCTLEKLTDSTKFGPREKKLYALIWRNTMESCMALCKCNAVTATISAPEDLKYKHSTEQVVFPGWKIVGGYEKKNPLFTFLQKIKNGTVMEYNKVYSKLVLKNMKTHYTEAKLVQLLEEKGIGRPSTFSALIDKIQERGYVKKEDVKGKKLDCNDYQLIGDELTEISTKREFGNEKNKLVLQPLGLITIEFLVKHFQDIFEYDYTKGMEDRLDEISKGTEVWYEMCRDCLNDLEDNVKGLKDVKRQMYQIDEYHTYMIGKYGPVIKYQNGKDTQFKAVKKNIDLRKLEKNQYKLKDILDDAPKNNVLGEYKDHEVVLKKGRYGLYIVWNGSNHSIASLRKEACVITLEDVIPFISGEKSGSKSVVRTITKDISIRRGKYGDYVFYKTSEMTKPQFLKLKGFNSDYRTCKPSELTNWLLNVYGIQ